MKTYTNKQIEGAMEILGLSRETVLERLKITENEVQQ